ncbi:phage tail protein [Salmonella enterica subsp. enterica]|nr:phage tail protein [Salmonella enterica subsp. enterica]
MMTGKRVATVRKTGDGLNLPRHRWDLKKYVAGFEASLCNGRRRAPVG